MSSFFLNWEKLVVNKKKGFYIKGQVHNSRTKEGDGAWEIGTSRQDWNTQQDDRGRELGTANNKHIYFVFYVFLLS